MNKTHTWNAVEHGIVDVEDVIAPETEFHLFVTVERHLVELSSDVETVTRLLGNLFVPLHVVLYNQRQLVGRFGQLVGRLFGRRFA